MGKIPATVSMLAELVLLFNSNHRCAYSPTGFQHGCVVVININVTNPTNPPKLEMISSWTYRVRLLLTIMCFITTVWLRTQLSVGTEKQINVHACLQWLCHAVASRPTFHLLSLSLVAGVCVDGGNARGKRNCRQNTTGLLMVKSFHGTFIHKFLKQTDKKPSCERRSTDQPLCQFCI